MKIDRSRLSAAVIVLSLVTGGAICLAQKQPSDDDTDSAKTDVRVPKTSVKPSEADVKQPESDAKPPETDVKRPEKPLSPGGIGFSSRRRSIGRQSQPLPAVSRP